MKKSIFSLLFLVPWLCAAAIYQLQIEGPIDTLSEEYIRFAFRTVRADPQARLVLILIDTPGGLDTSMREIIKQILDSPAPVAVLVHPRGARAASAGFFIAMAADIAAMAPGTNMGAAHPVSITGSDIEKTMKEKVTNDASSYIKSLARNRGRNVELAEKAVRDSSSYTAEECRQQNLCEHIAASPEELLGMLHGTKVRRIDGSETLLDLKSEPIRIIPMSNRQRFLKTITNPNLAYFLLIIGLIGLYIEFTHPGVIIPGVLGGICLLLAFLAFQVLPINYVGLALILLSAGLMIAEVKVQGFGILGVGGIAAFILGSIMLIDSPIPEMKPALSMIVTLAVCMGAIFLFLTYKVFRSMRTRPLGGQQGLIGEIGVTRSTVGPAGGKVFVHGEWWNARADEEIAAGEPVRIVAVDNLLLQVKKEGG